MAVKIVIFALALLMGALAQPTYNHVIGGAFTAVDAVNGDDSRATFAHPNAKIGNANRYPNGQFVPNFVGSGSLPGTHVYADDGSVFAVSNNGNELVYYDNATHSFGSRLFGTNGFFGYDIASTNYPNGFGNAGFSNRGANFYQGLIQNVAVTGASPSRTVLVCVSPTSGNANANRLVVGTNSPISSPNGLVNTGDTFGPFPPQLIAFQETGSNGAGFGGAFNFAGTPTVVTPSYTVSGSSAQLGVDCTTLVGTDGVFIVRANNGQWFHASPGTSLASSSWVALTRDPNANPSTGGGVNFNSNQFYVQDVNGGKVVYFYGPNPANLGNGGAGSQTDFYPGFYKMSVGSQGTSAWSAVFPVSSLLNVTVTSYVVGFSGDSDIYFTAQAYGGPNGKTNTFFPNSALDNVYFPLENYVFKTNGQTSGSNSFDYLDKNWRLTNGLARVAPGALNLHYETQPAPGSTTGGYIVVYGAGIGQITFGNQFLYNQKSPALVSGVSYDTAFYSKQYNKIVRYDFNSKQWLQAYGGGFTTAPSYVFSATGSKTTHFEGVSTAYQTYTGPLAAYNTQNNLNLWSYAYGITSGVSDFDGGADANGIYSSPALVTVAVPYTLSNTRGWIVGGQFRTLNNGGTLANSLVFLPASNPNTAGGQKSVFSDAGSANTFPTGVRNADLSAGNQVPENANFAPGLVKDAVVVNNFLVVAGSFNLVGNKYASNFGVWDLKNNGWSNALGGVGGTVNSILAKDDDVYVGGAFSKVGQNTLANNVARYNTKTGQWFTLNRGVDGTVYKLLNYGGQVLALGSFASASGQTVNNVALWDGSKWAPLSFFGGYNNSAVCYQRFCTLGDLTTSAVLDGAVVNGDLYVVVSGGSGVYKYRGSDHGWENVDGGAQAGGQSNTVVSSTSPSFVRGGQFIAPGVNDAEVDFFNYNYANNYPSNNVVTYNTDQSNWVDNNFKGVNGPVFFVAPQTTGSASSAFSVVASFSLLLALVFALWML